MLSEQLPDVDSQLLVRRTESRFVEVTLEFAQKIHRRLKPLVGVPLKGALQDAVQTIINAGVQTGETRDRQGQDPLPRFVGRFGPEHVATEEEMPEDDSRREDVGPQVGHLEVGLLRAHVVGLADDHLAFLLFEEAAGLGNSEVGEFHVPFEGDEDVFETDIAVDDPERMTFRIAFGMGVCQSARHPADDEHRKIDRQLPALVLMLIEERIEIDAADQLHGDEQPSLRLSEVVGLDDVGVDQIGHQLRLANEVLGERGLPGELGPDHFHRDPLSEPVCPQLFRLIDDAHPALREFAEDLVTELMIDGEQRHGAPMVGRTPVQSISCAQSSPTPGKRGRTLCRRTAEGWG